MGCRLTFSLFKYINRINAFVYDAYTTVFKKMTVTRYLRKLLWNAGNKTLMRINLITIDKLVASDYFIELIINAPCAGSMAQTLQKL